MIITKNTVNVGDILRIVYKDLKKKEVIQKQLCEVEAIVPSVVSFTA